MSKKHTLEWVTDRIERMGYKVLSKRYENSHTNLTLKDPHTGRIFKARWSNIQQSGIPAYSVKTKKGYDLQYVKEQIEIRGYKLLSKRYKNAHSFLHLECRCGTVFKRLWDDFINRDSVCPECRYQKY